MWVLRTAALTDTSQVQQDVTLLQKTIAGITVGEILRAVITLVVCIVAVKVLLHILNRTLERLNVDKTLHAFIRSLARILLYFLAAVIVLDSLGVPITSFVAVLSVIGLALSLAVQGVLANLAGGLQILLSKPFKVGDYVDANGTEGTAAEIGLVHTKLTTADNKVVYVPNSQMVSSKITNYSAMCTRRIELRVSAAYETPIERTCAALRQAAADTTQLLRDPAPRAAVFSFGENAIQYVLQVWCKTGDYWNAYFALNENVKKAFDAAGVQMTYNHLNVHLTDKR